MLTTVWTPDRLIRRGGDPPGERACNVRAIVADQSCSVQTTVTEYANEEEEEFNMKILIGLLERWECIAEPLRSSDFHPRTPPSQQEKKRAPLLFSISNHSKRIFSPPNGYLPSDEMLLNSIIKDRLRNIEIFIFKTPLVCCR